MENHSLGIRNSQIDTSMYIETDTILKDGTRAKAVSTATLDRFREMVSNKEGKRENKGYVRWVKESNGSYTVQKFNNKIDVNLSWRSRTLEKDYARVKEMFLMAVRNDLFVEAQKGLNSQNKSAAKFSALPETLRKSIEEKILTLKGEYDNLSSINGMDEINQDGEKGKNVALSRKQLKSLLQKYDNLKAEVAVDIKLLEREQTLEDTVGDIAKSIGFKYEKSQLMVFNNSNGLTTSINQSLLDLESVLGLKKKD